MGCKSDCVSSWSRCSRALLMPWVVGREPRELVQISGFIVSRTQSFLPFLGRPTQSTAVSLSRDICDAMLTAAEGTGAHNTLATCPSSGE
mgnify:CR=1 FL=1